MTYAESRGSCKNPYGGRINPGRIDFVEWIRSLECDTSRITGMQLLALTLISHTAADYLFYGLGRNGTTVNKFFEAVEFFWRTRSYRPQTWKDAPPIQQSYMDDTGRKVTVIDRPSDATLQLQCFDNWYEISGLHAIMHIDDFLEWLERQRIELIEENRAQVREYMDFLRRNNLPNKVGHLNFLLIESESFCRALIRPRSPEEIDSILVPQMRTHRVRQTCRPLWMRMRRRRAGRRGVGRTVRGQQDFSFETVA